MSTVKLNEQQKEWVVKTATGMVVLTFCYLSMIHPVFRDSTLLNQNILDSQKRIKLFRELRDLSASLDSMENVLATLTERSEILGRISDIAGRNQIRVQTLTPRTEPGGEYVNLRIDMDGQGSFLSLLKFLQAIEKIGAGIKIKNVSMLWKPSSSPQDSKYPLQIQLVFQTFLKQRARKDNV